jgi:hypothetical protein
MASAAAMLQVYRQQKEALIHNDLHAGNSPERLVGSHCHCRIGNYGTACVQCTSSFTALVQSTEQP